MSKYILYKAEAVAGFRFALWDITLAHPPKSEFVEKARKIKNLLFRQFIYVNLRIAGEVCHNLPFTRKCA